jgi:hypothetical protein
MSIILSFNKKYNENDRIINQKVVDDSFQEVMATIREME